ncbi:hypothetical protein UFOVP606_45 [uncultured Caudovirales phage]|uniref:Uncharacterized protein n=1 Tax=uncultured Caudovirales phage TaxID=2100421 RepID=A0A6J5N7F8_9CAUD|nr:hypothetical protein UFOVP606_45 [uncultured Caudovirales phage]
MAKRMLRDWTQSECINALSPMAEVFFVRLIMKADDYGSYYSNPKLLNAALFPLKEVSSTDITSFIDECEQAGILFTYEVLNKQYIRIVDFGQRLRVMNSKFPQPEKASKTSVRQSADIVRTFSRVQPLEEKRREVELELEVEDVIKASPNSNTIYTDCVDIWLKEIHIGWTFGGQQGKALKSLIKKIEQVLVARGFPLNNTADSFRMFCLHLPNWYKDKDLSILDSKFNEILEETKNGKQNGSKSSKTTDTVNGINELLKKRGLTGGEGI